MLTVFSALDLICELVVLFEFDEDIYVELNILLLIFT